MKKAVPTVAAAIALTTAALLSAVPSRAASHRDAPGIINDPAANITDVYAFVSGPDRVTLAMSFHPFQDPDEGPIWSYPSPDVLYEIHIKNNPEIVNGNAVFSGPAQISYQFRFSPPALQNPNTILAEGRGVPTGPNDPLGAGPIQRVGDGHQNLIQTYTVTRVDLTNNQRGVLSPGRVMILPPPNVGKTTTPLYNDASGMALQGVVDEYTRQATYDLGGGRRVFAGHREDGFYFDQGGTFDFLSLRNPGIDTFQGLNVTTLVLEVPKSDLVAANGPAIIGVYGTTSRRQVTVRRGAAPSFSAGTFQTVQRMGNPLFNEAFVAAGMKDRFSQTRPGQGNDEQFRTYIENPELAILANAVLLGSATPTTGPIPPTGRTDLSAVFIPDLLKLDTSTGPVRLPGQEGHSRFGVFGGDTVQSPFQNKAISSGWPNGRRFGDDVIDIGLTAIANPNATLTGTAATVVADNVDSNDVPYPTEFPYIGAPHSGFNHRHHGQPPAPAPPAPAG